MSQDHHRVRNFVVRELPRRGEPISLSAISEALGIAEARTAALVDELEKNLFFLARPGGREVSWAYPVTVDDTGHHLVIVVDSDLNHRIVQGGPAPLVFEPAVDWRRFKDPNIIDGY